MKHFFILIFISFLFVASSSNKVIAQNSTSSSAESLAAADTSKYATLYIYRPKNTVGALVGYNISMNDSIICKLKNGAKHAIKIYKEGAVKIWPHNETKKMDLNIKFGEEYFIKFALVSGLVGAHPELNMIYPEQGRSEYAAMEGRKIRNN